jgi:quinol monooxygenase YgiN
VILSFIEVSPLPGNREKILELLKFLVDSLETRRGCLDARVYEADDEKGTILYLEKWGSDEEFRRYVQSSLYLGLLNALDLAGEPPLVSFHEVADTKSLDLIAALRSPGVY